MKNILLAALLVLTFNTSFAQNKSGIKGLVIDSATNKPMEMVTIGITNLKDSTFVSYTSTTQKGEFSFSSIPSEKRLAIIASHTGFANFVKLVTLKKGETLDMGTIILKTQSKMLGEVVVSGQRQAITVNKDTIEFAVEAFKVRPNAVVEELLKKLPGVQIDNDGSIKVGGKAVSKLTIDGKEFFSNDIRIATKNLDAALLDKVQIFDDRENDPDHLIDDSKVSKIINLKFKRAFKKSIFGKVYGGGGSRNRFESGALFNVFRDTLQVSVIGVGNNLNKTGFSSNDLSQLGGFNRSGQDGIYNGTAAVGGNGWGGIEKILSGGFNLNNDYGKKLKMNLIYFYSNSQIKRVSSSFTQQYLNADTLLSNNTYNATSVTSKHNATGLVRWMPDSTLTITYTPKLSFTGDKNEASGDATQLNRIKPLTQSFNSVSNDNSSLQFQHTFTYHKTLKRKRESLTINHNLNINPDQSTDFNYLALASQTAAIKSETLDRLTDNANRNTSAGLDVSYRYPFSEKIIANVGASGRYSYDARRLIVFDKNLQTGQYTAYLDDQSTDLNRNQWSEGIKGGVFYQVTKKISFDVNLAGEFLQIRNRFNKNVPDAKQNYFNFLPSVRLQAYDFSVNYNTSVSLPSVYNIQPITVRTTQLYAFTGNPSLVPTRNHNFNVSYNKYIQKSEMFIYSNASASFDENSVINKSQISPEGITVNMPVNRSGQSNFNFSIGLSKKLTTSKVWQISFNPYMYFYRARTSVILNQNEGYQNASYFSIGQSASIGWREIVEITPQYAVIPQITSYSGVNFEKIKFTSHRAGANYTVRWPKHIYWEGNYNYNYNPLAAAGFQKSSNLLNLSVALQMLKKDRGELKLSCYDLLDQNINTYRYAGTNSITDSQNHILKRYFLLTYMVKFNKTTTK
ncbi:outer membrane beta-barrel protein [Mucilaginibacter terrae]|uniref:Outer membrane protein beta-barrel domain-containing protein n=1 Tax=Mucilaginibacter terrae TaxID=1955052 RepID=A0ABU3H0L8_9SPHI|nr:outer membrane beta-barrel protein [Mucilaginibacter terrae]MDT3405559.1 hypothetical protein [Mucilaginibacter terrae]